MGNDIRGSTCLLVNRRNSPIADYQPWKTAHAQNATQPNTLLTHLMPLTTWSMSGQSKASLPT